MTTVTLTPDQERFAAEAVARGRFRDVDEVVGASLELLRCAEAERASFLASLAKAEAESERHGFLGADDVHREMGAFIEEMGQTRE
jgi:putative addiction module CopG family antidote